MYVIYLQTCSFKRREPTLTNKYYFIMVHIHIIIMILPTTHFGLILRDIQLSNIIYLSMNRLCNCYSHILYTGITHWLLVLYNIGCLAIG